MVISNSNFQENSQNESPDKQEYPEYQHVEDPFTIDPNDDMDTLNEKLRISKQQRKQIENDAKLLQNRINLLQNEENKSRKKIESVRKQANDIKSMKQKNKQAQLQKQALRERRMQEEEEKKSFNKMVKQDL